MSASRPFRHGLVIGKFYPPHAGHLALVRAALARCDRVTVQVLASSQESLAPELRAAWLAAELPGAHVVHAVDDAPVDYADDGAWDAHVAVMRSLLDAPVDAVLTSDSYGAELASRLGATWVQVDAGRRGTPVSGSAVRADPAAYWWALPAPVRAWYVRRVVVLGAESTGTTTLAEALTAHYGLPAVPEFGREWSAVRPGGLEAPWHTAEFDLVAREQARLEDDAATRSPVPLLVCDTDPLATTLWHERYVGAPSPSVQAFAAGRVPDLYLLTGDEIPFVQDGLRDGEHVRHDMQARFREVLAAQADAGGAPWFELRGSHDERLRAAIELVDPLKRTPRPLAEPMVQHHGDDVDVTVPAPERHSS
ncbi:AAA family ATPase [Cellulomonas soli]|uniref:Transcriptional regulator NadR n=1 Tax=Cellulomonas soli TaxID=931535 RepID=A0A512PBD0_9CELL|nr:AAA family ATPase [Cellulomonas soli]NYI61107.1 NadR type nicotinamide-nucleotide adenylyltransferase [Cellulomonas soli]GEP68476.1 transcriptional regulator NadR [Cellulomonas soli]